MAIRRMFSKTITNSSNFLMMPQSSQNLYFHLGMNADDDGFCEHFTVMRMTESKPDDLKILQAKGLIYVFDDKVLVILDWKENNYLRADRYSPSKYLEIYKEEIKQISVSKIVCLPNGIPDVIPVDDTGKVRLGKDSIDKVRKKFIPPTHEEVSEYILQNSYPISADEFIDCYEARGWMVGKNQMKDWKAAVRNFVRNKIKWDKDKKSDKSYQQELDELYGGDHV